MLNNARRHNAAECEIDVKRESAFHLPTLTRLRIAFVGFAFSSANLDRPRRSVDRKIQELDHTFD